MKLLTKKIATALALICSVAATSNAFAGTTTRTVAANNSGGVVFNVTKSGNVQVKTTGSLTVYHPNDWCSASYAYCDGGRYYNFKVIDLSTNKIKTFYTPNANGSTLWHFFPGSYRIMLNEPTANFSDNKGSVTYRITTP